MTHANFLVGLNDLVCVIRAPLGESREDVLLHLLPRSTLVTDVAIELGERVAAHDHIAFAGSVSGTRNMMAVAICRGTDDLYGYLSDQLGQIEGVRGFEVDVRTQGLKAARLARRARQTHESPPVRATD